MTKQSLSCRVIDEKQIERHFNYADLNELYEFTPTGHVKRPTPNVPKDRLMAELVRELKEWIVAFHEHDSLLENKEDEELNEEERKAAWDEFENVKRDVQTSFTRSNLVNAPFNSVPTAGMAESAKSQNPMAEIDFTNPSASYAGLTISAIRARLIEQLPGITAEELEKRIQMTVSRNLIYYYFLNTNKKSCEQTMLFVFPGYAIEGFWYFSLPLNYICSSLIACILNFLFFDPVDV